MVRMFSVRPGKVTRSSDNQTSSTVLSAPRSREMVIRSLVAGGTFSK